MMVKAHRDELELDGYEVKTGGDIVRSLNKQSLLREIISTPGKQTAIFNNGIKMVFANRMNALFPKRAILRVGMLLRDSEVAKEVRTQLLNIEEHAATEVKTYEIGYKSVTGKEVREILVRENISPTKIEQRKGHFVVLTDVGELKKIKGDLQNEGSLDCPTLQFYFFFEGQNEPLRNLVRTILHSIVS